jgi:hypothetical protein
MRLRRAPGDQRYVRGRRPAGQLSFGIDAPRIGDLDDTNRAAVHRTRQPTEHSVR